ncbi:MAG TPA: tripartite tricarboxylate transporter substrate-binding protein [Xanthobacteraceae bacterium]|jgi:tripartite-type tricarboxylate transporter receptor subunit TctC|nr:tripartite tricarboxylate transporter substrate-binding protein [Xanthobacteraceae bacterium]
MRALTHAVALIACSVLSASPLWAQSPADFYKGKQITFVVSTEPGQDYDTWARLVARHMRQHVPGAPPFVIQNMPGAGSLIAANYLYNKAAQDGTVIGMVSRNIPNYALMRQPNVNYDPLKFNWIGSPEITHRGCYARSDSGIRGPDDLFTRELVVGGDGAGTALTETPVLLKNLLGMKFKLIDGYKGANGVILAMERGELQGICQTTSAFQGAAQRLLDDGTFRLLFTTEPEAVPELKVPTIFSYAKTDEQREILEVHASSLEIGRPILAPPNVPPDRVAALRRAFHGAVADPALLEEAKQMKLTVEARSGEAIAAAIGKIAALPAELVAKAAQMTRIGQ